MITIGDKGYHFAGAFTATTIGIFLFGGWGIVLAAVGSVLLEVYQWFYEKRYIGKELDTVMDLIFDAGGIWIAAVILKAVAG